MQSRRALPKWISHYLKKSQLHTSLKSLAAKDSSSSSSSDSSESDSDREITEKQNNLSLEKTSDRLNNLLLKIVETSTQKPKEISKSSDIFTTLKPRSLRFKNQDSKNTKNVESKIEPIEKKIVVAAKNVAKSLGGDVDKTELELLSKVLSNNLNLNKSTEKEESQLAEKDTVKDKNLGELLSTMKVDFTSKSSVENNWQSYEFKKQGLRRNSVTLSLLHSKNPSDDRRHRQINKDIKDIKEMIAPSSKLNIFQNLPIEEPENIPQMLTWKEMEQRDLRLATQTSPENIFQELILWTEQGKLWHFPINNEQGMEEEEKVHFSEHIFLERHLRDWCPKTGPLRYFMELVCTGLSKNPYMTVDEKKGHIMWYKNYFESKKDLINELETCQSDNTQQQIEA